MEGSGTAPTVFCWYIASTFSETRGLSSLNIISNQVETLLTKCLCLGPEGGHGLTTTKSCSSYFLLGRELTMLERYQWTNELHTIRPIWIDNGRVPRTMIYVICALTWSGRLSHGSRSSIKFKFGNSSFSFNRFRQVIVLTQMQVRTKKESHASSNWLALQKSVWHVEMIVLTVSTDSRFHVVPSRIVFR